MSTTHATTLPPGTPPRYQRPLLLAEGGSGRVYRVRDTVRGLDLALKLVGPGEAIWLRREFDTLRQIRHENLIQVFDWGTLESGGAYYTMELLEGGDWGQRKGIPQGPEEVHRILTGLLRGLAHLHCHDEIHGDLKPGNILLGAGFVVKVSDVGMAGEPESGTASGTPGFAAPEIWEGGRASVRSDIYSAGVMAYEALTGHHPFEGRTVRDVVSGQIQGWSPSLRARGAVVPADLEKSVMKAMERNPALRQSSADQFLEEIGVQDRVGQILGGKFVGRANQLARLRSHLLSDSPAAATVVHVCGSPGVGKTALIEEMAHQCLSEGGKVLEPAGGLLARMFTLGPEQTDKPATSSPEGLVSSVAEELWRLGTQGPVLVRMGSEPGRACDLTSMLQLGRFLSALAAERSEHSHVVLVSERKEAPETVGVCEDVIVLSSLDAQETEELARGFLGRLRLETEQTDRLHRATGGLPSAIRDLISDLISRQVLVRSRGEWSLRDLGELRELRHAGVPMRVRVAWDQLDQHHRRVLTGIAIFEKGVGVRTLSALVPGASATLGALVAKGWSAVKESRAAAPSQEIRTAILELAAPAERAELERAALAGKTSDINPTDRARVLLRHPDLPDALELGIASVEESFASHDYTQAAYEGQLCLEIALSRNDRDTARRALFLVADALSRVGRYEDTLSLLSGSSARVLSDSSDLARKERLVGTISRERGDLAGAREHLARAVALADAAGDTSMSLSSQAELAGLDWRYGDESERVAAMSRVRDVLARVPAEARHKAERAALTYQLGSAMILNGERQEAVRVLETALALDPGDYWRMRVANALATAEYYLGRFDVALEWMDEARRCAESSGSDSFKARIHSNRAGVLYGLGKFREAVAQHELSALWARRTGSMYEYQSSCAGAAINLIITARYEDGIRQAREAQRVAKGIGDTPELAKGFEVEALAHFHLGDYTEAERLVSVGQDVAADLPVAEAAPRLEWLAARLAHARDDLETAVKVLRRAETVLQRTMDWEDLPGVQIELEFLAFRERVSRFDPTRLIDLTLRAESMGAVLVFLRGALAVGQVLLELGRDHVEHRNVLLRALSVAETSGAAELAWQLSYLIGEMDLRRGDPKSAASRHGYALRALREIAESLTPDHRVTYIRTPHARGLLSRIEGWG